ncbi:chromate transporter [bacterium]|nr:chromate transporter [bacterium]
MIYFQLFWAFLKVGIFGWGGGSALYPLIEDQCMNNGWLGGDQQKIAELFAVTNAVPGVTAVKMAVYIGWQEAGLLGALLAAAGISLPGIGLLMGFYSAIINIQNNEEISPVLRRSFIGLINGLRFGAAGFILYSLIRVVPTDLSSAHMSIGISVALVAAVLLYFNVNPIPVILCCGIIGALILF